jgi:diguanylate cyclase (GGDEF)-like protein
VILTGDCSESARLNSWMPTPRVARSRHTNAFTEWDEISPIAWSVLGAPVGMALMAGLLVLALSRGWLIPGSAGWGSVLSALSLTLAAVSLGFACWQHGTIIGPLRRLAVSRAAADEPCEHDQLTGLLTASSLQAGATRALGEAVEAGGRLILLVADVDRLRDINGLYGYGFGDEVLRQIARRIAILCPAAPAVARIGGDRFAMLVQAPPDGGVAANWPAGVIEALGRPFCVAGCELTLCVHGGAAVFPEHGASFHQLMRAAELALETARRSDSRRWSMFDPHMNRVITAQKALERELRRAIEQQALILHYQPQVDLATGRVTGLEALLRSPHPEKGLIPPQSFIPLAEASGLIRPLGAWVLAEACRAARRWRDQGVAIGVSVNVSAAQLKHQDLVAVVAQVLEATGLTPEVLELELTESMFVDPTQLAMHRAIQGVAAMGVRLAIDDFGTGYSSLGYLKRLPVHKIKIDRSFVRELGRDDADAAIVRSIIGLARTFGKRVLAEGVEELGQFHFLLAEGCHEAQGFYFSRPMPEDACTAFLKRHADVPQPTAQPKLQVG